MGRVSVSKRKSAALDVAHGKQRTLGFTSIRIFSDEEVLEESNAVVDEIEVEYSESIKAKNVALAKKKWQPDWKNKWRWLEFDEKEGLLFCTLCKGNRYCKNPFGKGGSSNFKTSSFHNHGGSDEHKHSIYLQEVRDGYQLSLGATQKKNQETVDKNVVVLFRCAYFLAKWFAPFRRFPELIQLERLNGNKDVPSMYNSEVACTRFISTINKVILDQVLQKVKASPYFGLMVDESTDISVSKHLIFYATFIQNSRVENSYMGIVAIQEGDAGTIFYCIQRSLKDWGLDFQKCMGFGSDGCSVMAGNRTGVAARLKDVNPYMSSIHCIAHRADLCIQDCFKSENCKAICDEMDNIVNKIAAFFSRSPSRMQSLMELERELDYNELRLQRIQDTRWLSRHQAISKLCECMKPVLELFKNYGTKQADKLFQRLRTFKNIYILHFLGDILAVMSQLSLEFQSSNIDVTVVGSLCRRAMAKIQLYYLTSNIDLNANLQDSRCYPIIPDGGIKDGLLAELRSAVRGDDYRTVELIRLPSGEDLQQAIEFQKRFAKTLVDGIKSRLEESAVIGTLSKFVVLAPINLPSSLRELKPYGMDEVKALAEFYGKDHIGIGGGLVHRIIDADSLVREYSIWKITASEEWTGRSFQDTWGIIYGHPIWKDEFPNLLKVATIGMIQCCSTAACECGFSRINLVKTKFRNRLSTTTLDELVRISLEGAEIEEFDFAAAVLAWKESSHYRQIYTST